MIRSHRLPLKRQSVFALPSSMFSWPRVAVMSPNMRNLRSCRVSRKAVVRRYHLFRIIRQDFKFYDILFFRCGIAATRSRRRETTYLRNLCVSCRFPEFFLACFGERAGRRGEKKAGGNERSNGNFFVT